MFRLDINGLRFIAVSMVVLFHFKFGYFYGGYAGVDVFFVISGFLMQYICSKEINTKGWVINFYKKRFRRIYPALLFSVLFTSFLILYSETPQGVYDGLKQAISALTFTSNIYYKIFTGNYFSTTSEFNWLLHTWSLSVEWQYYMVFPLVLFIVNKAGRLNSVVYLLLILISFCTCLYFGPYHDKANFYLLPTRAWELMTGAYIATLTIKNKHPRLTECISVTTLVLFTLFSKDSGIWPGMTTIIPVLATAAIIHANVGNEKTILRNSIIQKIGAASYSIYLFHWPIVAFMANNAIEFTTQNSIIALIASISLGFFSYHYLESLFIKKDTKLILSAITLSLSLLIISKSEISKLWISSDTIALDEYKTYTSKDEYKKQFGLDAGECFLTSGSKNTINFDKKCLSVSTSKKNILLIGDSHAAQYSGSIKKIFPDYNVLQASASGCMPFSNPVGEERCTRLMHYIFNDFLKENKIDYVFISAFWSISKDQNPEQKLIETVKSIKWAKVFIIGQTKSFNTPFYKIAQKTNKNDIEKLVQSQSIETNKRLLAVTGDNGVNYIDIFNTNCHTGKCTYFTNNKIPMLFDDNHLTQEWADIYTSNIKLATNL